jgi:hypothetical protein
MKQNEVTIEPKQITIPRRTALFHTIAGNELRYTEPDGTEYKFDVVETLISLVNGETVESTDGAAEASFTGQIEDGNTLVRERVRQLVQDKVTVHGVDITKSNFATPEAEIVDEIKSGKESGRADSDFTLTDDVRER